MALSKLPFTPGIHKEGSQYSAGLGWFDADKVRFRKGRPEQIGGWIKYTEVSYMGVCRSLLDWGSSSGKRYIGLGTNLKFYVETGGTITDVTPVRETTAASAITFDATDGLSTLTVTDTDHGAVISDFVTYSDAVSLGGNITAAVLNQEYQVTSLIDTDNYTIEAKDTAGDPVVANASDTGNGLGTTSGEYQLNTGTNSYVEAVGYGLGSYGSSPWGGGGSLLFSGQLRLYSQTVFGDDIIFNPRAGGIFYWDESAGVGVRSVDLNDLGGASDAPTAALQVMVSPVDRHVIAFGVSPLGSTPASPLPIDPLLIRWSDQESAADWTPTATNSAGGHVLSSGTQIIGAVRTRQEILIFTDTTIHAMRFSGSPFIFGTAPVAENISLISPKAAISAGGAVYFMDMEGFYVYKGAAQQLVCTVQDYVFSEMDVTQLYKIYATNNPDDSEVTWFYPAGPEGSDITKYVTYNYASNEWTIGTFARGAWIQASTKSHPVAASNDVVNVNTNYLYSQEYGYDAEGQNMGAYIVSGQVEIGDGESLMFIDRFISDFKVSGAPANAEFTVTLSGSKYPNEAMTVKATKTVYATTGQSNVRARARAISMRIDSVGTGYGWTMGDFRFDMRTDGKR
jgi:hypothetical protein